MIRVNFKFASTQKPELHMWIEVGEELYALESFERSISLMIDLYNSRALRWRYLAIVHGAPYEKDDHLENKLAMLAEQVRKKRPPSKKIRQKAERRSQEANLTALQLLRHTFSYIEEPYTM